MTAGATPLGWPGIFRLGLVQAALGSVVVLTTSTLNRIMVVELALPAMLPGMLVALHYFVQLSRPRFGHGSDLGGRRTPWIVGGIALLGAGGIVASLATAWMATSAVAGTALAVAAFVMIGAGVGAGGTCLLVLLAERVAPERRAAAATVTWIMMIAGLALTASLIGAVLDPFSFERLVIIAATVAAVALLLTVTALWGIEGAVRKSVSAPAPSTGSFRARLAEVAREPLTWRFTVFVFVAMLAYSAQDLVLEPFAGAIFGYTPGESTQLGGTQHGGVLVGMLIVAALGSRYGRTTEALQRFMVAGCIGSALLLGTLAAAGFAGPGFPLGGAVFALGVANGVFAVAAIGAMMGLVSRGRSESDGMRMGIWGAAQAIAFGIGGFAGTVIVDVIRLVSGSPLYSFAAVFLLQAIFFAFAAHRAARLQTPAESGARTPPLVTEAGSA